MELKFDYVKFGNKVIYYVATVLAVIVAVVSYAYTAMIIWWDDNKDEINSFVKTNVNRVFSYLTDVTQVEVAQ